MTHCASLSVLPNLKPPLIESDDAAVAIAVRDHGVGFEASQARQVFHRFWRGDAARARAVGGTGLGLAIVKHIAAIHGGEVSVWSQVARGSTFTIKIPAHLHDVAPAAPEHTASRNSQQPPYQLSNERQEIIQ